MIDNRPRSIAEQIAEKVRFEIEKRDRTIFELRAEVARLQGENASLSARLYSHEKG